MDFICPYRFNPIETPSWFNRVGLLTMMIIVGCHQRHVIQMEWDSDKLDGELELESVRGRQAQTIHILFLHCPNWEKLGQLFQPSSLHVQVNQNYWFASIVSSTTYAIFAFLFIIIVVIRNIQFCIRQPIHRTKPSRINRAKRPQSGRSLWSKLTVTQFRSPKKDHRQAERSQTEVRQQWNNKSLGWISHGAGSWEQEGSRMNNLPCLLIEVQPSLAPPLRARPQ